MKSQNLEKSLASLKSARVEATAVPVTRCDLCSKSCKIKANVKDHEETIIANTDKFQYTQCTKWFKSKEEHDAHVKSTHEDTSRKSCFSLPDVLCSFCDKEFTTFLQLITHIKTFHNEAHPTQPESDKPYASDDWTKNYPEIEDLIENCQSIKCQRKFKFCNL